MIKKLWRAFWCRMLCPNYIKSMPKDASGSYVAYSYTVVFGHMGRIVGYSLVVGRREAYKEARWLALLADFAVPHAGGEIGVNWGLVPIAQWDQDSYPLSMEGA